MKVPTSSTFNKISEIGLVTCSTDLALRRSWMPNLFLHCRTCRQSAIQRIVCMTFDMAKYCNHWGVQMTICLFMANKGIWRVNVFSAYARITLWSEEAGKKYTVGAIYIVCLKLPPSLHRLVKNKVFVGIIPSPHKPSKEQINHFLVPLVNDLLVFYNPGAHYSCTACYSKGRRICLMFGPLVCDLPAF